jgi:LPXTG-site transpeptidase (sortase) family protein
MYHLIRTVDPMSSEEPFASPPPLVDDVAFQELPPAPTVMDMSSDRRPTTPGWYPDPAGSELLRFFDGQVFTHVTRPADEVVPSVKLDAPLTVPAFQTPAFAADTMEASSAFLSPPSSTPELHVPWYRTVGRLLLPRPHGVRAALRLAGTLCLMVSLSTLGYALWENRLSAWTAERAQHALRSEYDNELALQASRALPSVPPPSTVGRGKGPDVVLNSTPPSTSLPPQLLAHGKLAGRLTIPTLGLDKMVLMGTDTDILAKGPGVWETGVFPGAPGNAMISGHRTTHGGPFRHLDDLQVGDQIIFETPGQPRAVFEVRGTGQVSPKQVEVTGQGPGVRLTLTTCDPPGSTTKRLVIQAELIEGAYVADALPPAEWKFRG